MSYFTTVTQFNDLTAAVAYPVAKPQDIEYLYTKDSGDPLVAHLNELSYTVTLTKKDKLKDVLQNSIDLLLFSNRLKEKIEEKKIQGISFFKQINISIKQENYTPYWYAHLEYLPEGALDIDAAGGKIIELDGVKIYSYIKPVLKQDVLHKHNLDIFRIPESKPAEFVSERFKNLFEENNFTGIEFLPVKVI